MRWLLWPSTIRAAYWLGGAGEEQLSRQAATRLAANSLGLMVTVQRYQGRTSCATGRTDKRRDYFMAESRPPDARHGLGSHFSARDDRYFKSRKEPLREDFLIVLLLAATTVVCGSLVERPQGWRQRRRLLGPRQTIRIGRSQLQTSRYRSSRNRSIPDRGIEESVELSYDSENWTTRIPLSFTIDQDSRQDQLPAPPARAQPR